MTKISKIHDLRAHAAGPITPSVLLGLAETTVAEAGKMSGAAFPLVSVTAHYHAAHPTPTVRAAAEILDRRGALTVWQVDLRAADRRPLAEFTLHYLADAAGADGGSAAASQSDPADHFRQPQDDKLMMIAEAACGVISEKGFAAASIREIAAAAGMHVPTMYQYVRSKEEVLEHVYYMVIARVNANVGPAFDLRLPPREKLLRVIESFVRNNGSMRKEAGVLNRELRSLSPAARQRVLANYRGVTEKIAAIITEGISVGEFRHVNPQLMANMIDALCDMWSLRPFALNDVEEKEYLRELRRLLFDGIAMAGEGGHDTRIAPAGANS